MKGTPTDFLGKLDRTDAFTIEWHPLIDHCADVAATAATLLALPTWRHRLARLSGHDDLDELMRARLSVFAALHDLGKFNIGFQANGRPELGIRAGHVREALSAIGKNVLSSLEPLGNWGGGALGLLASAICHHGRPYALSHTTRFEPVLWGARDGLDPKAGVEALVQRCRAWFPAAFNGELDTMADCPALEHAFAGLVMLADWIGSDRRVFPFSTNANDRMPFALSAAERFVAKSWLGVDGERRADSRDRNPFERVARPGYQARPAQAAMLSLPLGVRSSITILECETGSGKTEAALAHFVALFGARAVDGLYFALPTRTAATEIYRRVFDAVQQAFKTPPPVVLAVPGYIRVDDTAATKLPQFKVLWPDEGRFRYRGWAGEAPKRYLSGCIVVGTVDQVLLSSLRVSHAHLRATALLRQLLVVDEVHASDAYMTRILEQVLARHIDAGGHALLLSATLGAETRERLLNPGAATALPNLAQAIGAPYPSISCRGMPRMIEVPREAADSRRLVRQIHVSTEAWMESHKAVATAAVNAAVAGAKVLVIKNTVSDCVDTQRALERISVNLGRQDVLFLCAGVAAPHHARFARVDRESLDAALEERFGASTERRAGGCVVVATQTVQQSLDLDADLMFTDLCPMDVLLQRLGRLHRRSRVRPSGFEEARAIVVVPADRDLGILLGREGKARHHHGLGSVYPDLRVLEATWRLIQMRSASAWEIPEISRELVERCIHSSAVDEISREKGEAWEVHGQRMIGTRYGERRQADLNLVDWTHPYSETSFSDDVRIPTRLGDGDRRVQFDSTFTGPFGLPIDELSIRATWAAGMPSDACTGRVTSSADGVTRFEFAHKVFVYSRYGLERHRDEDQAVDDSP